MPAARGLNTKARMPYLLGLSPAKRFGLINQKVAHVYRNRIE